VDAEWRRVRRWLAGGERDHGRAEAGHGDPRDQQVGDVVDIGDPLARECRIGRMHALRHSGELDLAVSGPVQRVGDEGGLPVAPASASELLERLLGEALGTADDLGEGLDGLIVDLSDR